MSAFDSNRLEEIVNELSRQIRTVNQEFLVDEAKISESINTYILIVRRLIDPVQDVEVQEYQENEQLAFNKIFSKLEEQEELKNRGIEVQSGLWAQMTKDGGLLFVITNLTEENFTEVVKRLSHNNSITWSNIPSKHQAAAEIASLRAWRRAEFNDGNGPKVRILSGTMPDIPGSWTQWLQNINNHFPWSWMSNSPKRRLIQRD